MKTVLTSIVVASLNRNFFVSAECKEKEDVEKDYCQKYDFNPAGCDTDPKCEWFGLRLSGGSVSEEVVRSETPRGSGGFLDWEEDASLIEESRSASLGSSLNHDVVSTWLKKEGATLQDSSTKYTLHRVAALDIPVEHASEKWTLSIPMYLAHIGNWKWLLYIIPKDFYKLFSKRKYKSNSELQSADFVLYNAYLFGGAEILLHVDPNKGDFTAQIKNIRMGDVETEQTLMKDKDGAHDTKWRHKMGFWWAVKGGDIKLTHVFAAALDTVYKKLGVQHLKCSDQAYHSCGFFRSPNAAISQLFLRVFGHQQKSLYMKDEFGFDIKDDNPVMTRSKWDEAVQYLHSIPWAVVMSQYTTLGADITELEKAVKKRNGKNTKKDKRVVASFENSALDSQEIGDVMTMLWYRGDTPSCGVYMDVFQFLYGATTVKGKPIHGVKCHYQTKYCQTMHQVIEAVQTLVKDLKLDDSRIKMDIPPVAYVPQPSFGHYFYPYYNGYYPQYDSTTLTLLSMLLGAFLMACACGVGICALGSFGAGWYYFGRKDETMQVPSNV